MSLLSVEQRCVRCGSFEPVSDKLPAVEHTGKDSYTLAPCEVSVVRCAKYGTPDCPDPAPGSWATGILRKDEDGYLTFRGFRMDPHFVTRVNGVDLLSLQETLCKIKSAKHDTEFLAKTVDRLKAWVIAGFSSCAIAIVVLAVVLGRLA